MNQYKTWEFLNEVFIGKYLSFHTLIDKEVFVFHINAGNKNEFYEIFIHTKWIITHRGDTLFSSSQHSKTLKTDIILFFDNDELKVSSISIDEHFGLKLVLGKFTSFEIPVFQETHPKDFAKWVQVNPIWGVKKNGEIVARSLEFN